VNSACDSSGATARASFPRASRSARLSCSPPATEPAREVRAVGLPPRAASSVFTVMATLSVRAINVIRRAAGEPCLVLRRGGDVIPERGRQPGGGHGACRVSRPHYLARLRLVHRQVTIRPRARTFFNLQIGLIWRHPATNHERAVWRSPRENPYYLIRGQIVVLALAAQSALAEVGGDRDPFTPAVARRCSGGLAGLLTFSGGRGPGELARRLGGAAVNGGLDHCEYRAVQGSGQ